MRIHTELAQEHKRMQQEVEEKAKQKPPTPIIESPRRESVILIISQTIALAQGQNG